MEDKRTEQYRQELKEFVMSHTEDVLKNPRSFIRYPFIDPGSVYDGNVWDWDTYWSVYGFLVTFMIYGGIMNPAALFMSVYQFSWSGLLAIYISGVPVDLVHASSTFLFLWIGAKPLLEKLQRIKVKYGLL